MGCKDILKRSKTKEKFIKLDLYYHKLAARLPSIYFLRSLLNSTDIANQGGYIKA